MRNSLIVDTGFWIALINDRDRFHQRAVEYLATCRQRLITTWPVITETCYMLLSRRGIAQTREFLLLGANNNYEVFHLDNPDLEQASLLMEQYADLPMDLADASMVILAEKLGHGRILSTDQRDFDCYRWKHHKPFQNMLLPDT